MKCPECKKGEIKENITYRPADKVVWGKIKNNPLLSIKSKILGQPEYIKIFTYFCPLCDFHREKHLRISSNDAYAELRAKSKGKGDIAEAKVEFEGFSVETKKNGEK